MTNVFLNDELQESSYFAFQEKTEQNHFQWYIELPYPFILATHATSLKLRTI